MVFQQVGDDFDLPFGGGEMERPPAVVVRAIQQIRAAAGELLQPGDLGCGNIRRHRRGARRGGRRGHGGAERGEVFAAKAGQILLLGKPRDDREKCLGGGGLVALFAGDFPQPVGRGGGERPLAVVLGDHRAVVFRGFVEVAVGFFLIEPLPQQLLHRRGIGGGERQGEGEQGKEWLEHGGSLDETGGGNCQGFVRIINFGDFQAGRSPREVGRRIGRLEAGPVPPLQGGNFWGRQYRAAGPVYHMAGLRP